MLTRGSRAEASYVYTPGVPSHICAAIFEEEKSLLTRGATNSSSSELDGTAELD